MKQVDSIVQSFDIRDDEIEFERNEEGNDLVLGHGAYGQVCRHLTVAMFHSNCWHEQSPRITHPFYFILQPPTCPMRQLCCHPAQVYKGLRGGVQEVAVKVLFDADEAALSRFIKVCPL
jgi:hypothetical protein